MTFLRNALGFSIALQFVFGLMVGQCVAGDAIEFTDCAIRLQASNDKEVRVGTAFFARATKDSTKKYIITAYHNVQGMADFFLLFQENGSARRLTAEIVTDRVLVRPELDLAVFQCTEEGAKKLESNWESFPCNRRALPLAKNRFIGRQVIAVGNAKVQYPAGERRPLNSPAWAFISEYTSWEKVLHPRWYEKSAAAAPVVVLTNIDITSGHSGGPVIVVSGERSGQQIVGMLVGGDPKNPSHCWAVPSDAIVKCLEEGIKEAVSLKERKWIRPKLLEGGYSSADTALAYPYSISVRRPTVAIAPLQLPDGLKKEVTPETFTNILHKYGQGGVCYDAVSPGPYLRQIARQYQAKPLAGKEIPDADKGKLGADYLLLAALSIDGDEWVMTGSLLDLRTMKAEPVNSVRAKNGAGALEILSERFWREFDNPSPILLEGHTGLVTSIELSLDGRTAVSAGMDKTLRVWDVASKKQRFSIPMQSGFFGGGTISRDGRFLAFGGPETALPSGRPRILDLKTGKDWEPFPDGGLAKLPKFGIQPNRTGGGGGVTIKNFETEREYPAIGHPGKLGLPYYSPKGMVFAEAQKNDVWIWEGKTGKKKFTLTGHKDVLGFIEFSPDGGVLATAAADKAVRLWDMNTGKELANFAGYAVSPFWMRFSEDGKLLALWSYGDKAIRIIDVPNRRLQAVLRLPDRLPDPAPDHFLLYSYPRRAHFTVDNGRLIIPWGREIRVWNTKTGQEQPRLLGHTDMVLVLTVSSDGRRLASGSKDKTVRLWDLVTSKDEGTMDFKASVYSVGFSKDSQMIAAQCESELTVVEVRTKKVITLFTANWKWDPPGVGETNSPNGEITAIPGAKEVQLRSKRSGKVYASLKGGAGRVLFSPNSRLIATESFLDKQVRMFDTNLGWPALDSITVEDFFGFSFSADSRWLAVAANKGAGVWDMSTRTRQISLPPTGKTIFSADSKVLIAVPNKFADKWLRVWDLRLGKERASLRGLEGLPSGFGLFFFNWGLTNPDGYVVAASFGNTVALWPIREGKSSR